MKAKRKSKRELFKKLTEHGIHIWAIVILANVMLVYSISFQLNANKNVHLSAAESETTQVKVVYEEPTPTPTPVGPIFNIAFTVPGIGSGEGNLKPLHKTRDVTLFFYPTSVNPSNINVKPQYIFKTKARFDDNVNSPTYTTYLNSYIDLGASIQDGDYQVSFKTNQSFRTLIKDRPNDLQGELFRMEKGVRSQFGKITTSRVILGDIAPLDGDNIAGLDDYKVFVTCFGEGNKTSECPSPNIADLNDDGFVDSLDYNLLVINYKQLASMGIPVPTIYIAPTSSKVSRISYLKTPTPKKDTGAKTKARATPTPVPAKSSGGSLVGGIIFFIFVIILGIGGFVLFKINPKFNALVRSVLFSKIASPGTPEAPAAPSPATPAIQPIVKDPNMTEYYLKKQGNDETNTGFWLDLTGDTGQILGHYKGKEIKDSFAQVKGVMKTENGKTFLEISEIVYE